MPVDNRSGAGYGRAVLRTVTILLAALLLLAVGVEASCCGSDGGDDCCCMEQCSFCTQSAVASPNGVPLILPHMVTALVADDPIAPFSPDLGRLTPPPRF